MQTILKNRIVGSGERAAKEFNAHALNWRRHPDAQKQAISAVLEEVGWVSQVIVNRTTGNTIDGHARIDEALERGPETPVPFVEVELSEAEEKKILAIFDKIGAMAVTDLAAYNDLIAEISFESAILSEIAGEPLIEELSVEEFFEEIVPEREEKFTLEIDFDSETEYRAALDALGKISPNVTDALRQLLDL